MSLKKTKYQALVVTKEKAKGFVSLSTITLCFGLKRDAYYKDKRLEIEKKVVDIVKNRRKSLPREGVRKLTRSLEQAFIESNLKIGRDTLFNILRKHNMLTLRKKYSSKTTNSLHRFYKYNNRIKDLMV